MNQTLRCWCLSPRCTERMRDTTRSPKDCHAKEERTTVNECQGKSSSLRLFLLPRPSQHITSFVRGEDNRYRELMKGDIIASSPFFAGFCVRTSSCRINIQEGTIRIAAYLTTTPPFCLCSLWRWILHAFLCCRPFLCFLPPIVLSSFSGATHETVWWMQQPFRGDQKKQTHRATERAPTGINGWDKRIIEKYTFHSRCCRVCAKTVGESCGGPGGFSGTCEPPLQCVQRLQMKGSGVCLGGYTINYRISSLNIHVQSTCIEGGCLDCWLDYCCCCSSSSSTVRISMPCSV